MPTDSKPTNEAVIALLERTLAEIQALGDAQSASPTTSGGWPAPADR